MKKHVLLSCICLLLLVSLVWAPVLAAPLLSTVTCPSSCSCLLPAEAAKINTPGLCGNKQLFCGNDTQKNEKYCYEKPATPAVPRLIVTAKPYVTTTTIVPNLIVTVKPFVTTLPATQPLPTTTGLPPVAGFPGIVTTKPEIPPVSPVNYSELYTSEVTCPAGCACLLSADAKNRGLSYCGGKQTTCTITSDFSLKGTITPAETRHCYTIPVAAGTSPNLTRVAVVNRTPAIPIPLPEECPGGCSCLDEKTIHEKGYSDCSSEKTECGYSKAGEVMYCARTGSASIGQPDTIFSAIGKFFGTLFGGNPVPESRVAVDLCRQRYGLETCDGGCVDFLTDENNCGGCGNWCNSDPNFNHEIGTAYTCYLGQCVRRNDLEGPGTYRCGIGGTTECPAGAPCLEGVCSALGCLVPELTDCNNICVRTSDDEANCGSCGHVCLQNQTCLSGECSAECEDPGTGFCRNVIDSHWYCADLSSDPDHCGRCQHTCPSSMVCGNGDCVSECPAGLTDCGDLYGCTDTMTSRRNCGGCGHACNNDEICSGGTCVRCPAGTTSCWDYDHCVDFMTDEWNCGGCGIKCGEGEFCADGTCERLTTMPSVVVR